MKHPASLTLAAALISAHLSAEAPHYLEQVTQTQSYLNHYTGPAAYAALNRHFALQTTDASCSAASITMIVNALSPDKHYTEMELVKRINIPAWSVGIANGGDGINLDQLGDYLEATFDKLGLPYEDIRVVHLENLNEARKVDFVKVLQNLNSPRLNSFVLVNFDDFDILPIDYHMGHICPVGAYDPVTNQVLLMDVDKELQDIPGWKNGPHWVKLDNLYKAMYTRNADNHGKTPPPFRGYVVLTLNSRSH